MFIHSVDATTVGFCLAAISLTFFDAGDGRGCGGWLCGTPEGVEVAVGLLAGSGGELLVVAAGVAGVPSAAVSLVAGDPRSSGFSSSSELWSELRREAMVVLGAEVCGVLGKMTADAGPVGGSSVVVAGTCVGRDVLGAVVGGVGGE